MLYFGIRYTKCSSHPPCEDVDWNVKSPDSCIKVCCHPPCEDVDWNQIRTAELLHRLCHPPCEDVDWNSNGWLRIFASQCHPPCEDVDWNSYNGWPLYNIFQSSSVWGCGLKSWIRYVTGRWELVILRVRMWIEIYWWGPARRYCWRHPPCEGVDWNRLNAIIREVSVESPSVWGCGLKLTHFHEWYIRYWVILRVRMWIEITGNWAEAAR